MQRCFRHWKQIEHNDKFMLARGIAALYIAPRHHPFYRHAFSTENIVNDTSSKNELFFSEIQMAECLSLYWRCFNTFVNIRRTYKLCSTSSDVIKHLRRVVAFKKMWASYQLKILSWSFHFQISRPTTPIEGQSFIRSKWCLPCILAGLLSGWQSEEQNVSRGRLQTFD